MRKLNEWLGLSCPEGEFEATLGEKFTVYSVYVVAVLVCAVVVL